MPGFAAELSGAKQRQALAVAVEDVGARVEAVEDRKSTRLNSSHRTISYAVFCLKKKKMHAYYVHSATVTMAVVDACVGDRLLGTTPFDVARGVATIDHLRLFLVCTGQLQIASMS